MLLFFFSSRRRHTRWTGDWSSDVCSSDLQPPVSGDRLVGGAEVLLGAVLDGAHRLAGPLIVHVDVGAHAGEGLVLLLVRIRSEERRVGKECRSWCAR